MPCVYTPACPEVRRACPAYTHFTCPSRCPVGSAPTPQPELQKEGLPKYGFKVKHVLIVLQINDASGRAEIPH